MRKKNGHGAASDGIQRHPDHQSMKVSDPINKIFHGTRPAVFAHIQATCQDIIQFLDSTGTFYKYSDKTSTRVPEKMDNDPNAPPAAKKVGKASNAECTSVCFHNTRLRRYGTTYMNQ